MASGPTEMSAPCYAQLCPALPSAVRCADLTRPLCVRILESAGLTVQRHVEAAYCRRRCVQAVLSNQGKGIACSTELTASPRCVRLTEMRHSLHARKNLVAETVEAEARTHNGRSGRCGARRSVGWGKLVKTRSRHFGRPGSKPNL